MTRSVFPFLGNEIPVDDKQAEDVAAKTKSKSKEEKRTVTEGQSVNGSDRTPVDDKQAETMAANKAKSKSKKERVVSSEAADSVDSSKVEKETLTSGTADSKTAEPVMSTANQAPESAAAEAQAEPEQEREVEEEPKKAATG